MSDRFLRRPEVLALLGVSHGTLYNLIDRRAFPRPVSIGERAVGWSRRAVDEWMQARIKAAEHREH